MSLLVDIGNSRTKYITVENLNSGQYQVIPNEKLTHDWLDENWLGLEKIILATVSKTSTTDTIKQWSKKNAIQLRIIESEAARFGVTSFYQEPIALGVDRWLALLGAAKLYPMKNILIVDSGTATTLDLLAANGKHKGGWILPGIDMMRISLFENTSKVKVEKTALPQVSFGSNTQENVNNACWAATLGTIEIALVEAEKQNTRVELIILSGGNAKNLSNLINHHYCIENNLIFHGLQRYN